MTSPLLITALTLLLFLISPAALSARTWTNDKGKSVQGDFVSLAGKDKVILRIKNKEHRIDIKSLSQLDQEWLKENGNAETTPKKSPPRSQLKEALSQRHYLGLSSHRAAMRYR